MSFQIQKAMRQFIKDTQISEKKYQSIHNLRDKKKYQNIHNLRDKTGRTDYCNYKVIASKSFIIDNHKIHKSQ